MAKDYFQSEEFKKVLRIYEQRQDKGKSVYLDAEDFADIADYYLSIDKIDLATETLNMGKSIHPENESLLVVQSTAYMLQRMYNEAENILKKLDINNSDVKYQVAQIQYAKYHDDEKAEKIWREWLILDNKEASPADERWREDYIHIISSITELRGNNSKTGEKDWSVEMARKWINEYIEKFQPLGRFESDIHLADICRESDLTDLMCQVLVQILEEQPYLKKGWSNLALAYYTQGNCEQALEACDFALAVDPDDMESLLTKAHTLNLMGEKIASKPIFKEYLDKGGDAIQAIPYAEALFLNKENEEALKELSWLRSVFKEKKLEAGDLWFDTPHETEEDRQKAKAQYEEFNDLFEKVFTDIGDLYYHHGYYEECLNTHISIITDNPFCAESYFMMGVCYLALNSHEKASGNFACALKHADDQVMMGVDIALTFILNDFDAFALDVLDAISKIAANSNSPFVKNISVAKSLAYLKTGNAEQFLHHFKTACQVSPELVEKVFDGYFPSDMPIGQWSDYAEKEIDMLLKKFKKENLYITGNS